MTPITSEEIFEFAEKLNKKGKPITRKDIMEQFNLSKHAAGKHLNYLEEKGKLVFIEGGPALRNISHKIILKKYHFFFDT
jgi:Fic family protein